MGKCFDFGSSVSMSTRLRLACRLELLVGEGEGLSAWLDALMISTLMIMSSKWRVFLLTPVVSFLP
jgi:hypothetical protein